MPKRDQTHMEERRRHILQAATACFMSEGYDNTTMKLIGERAGISIGGLYIHFKNKREVMTSILEQQRGWHESTRISTLAQLKQLWANTVAELTDETTADYRFNISIMREALNDHKLRVVMGKYFRSVNLDFVRLLTRLQKVGQIDAGYNVEVGALRIYTISTGIVFWHYQDGVISLEQVKAIFDDELSRMAPGRGKRS